MAIPMVQQVTALAVRLNSMSFYLEQYEEGRRDMTPQVVF